ncbi:MAG TPA: plasmid mobilization relaxosome protein MobC [Bryobacteraceae bacterium]|nr:plasmid mobilization relaxosome protein MobC [Bryobacteraceae bacterium]
MNQAGDFTGSPGLSGSFAASAETRRTKRRRGSPIFPIRFSAEERARLSKEAGETPLATYIKFRLFNNLPPLETFRPSRLGGRLATDTQLIAKLLAALGDARLANNLNQLAKAANMGTIDASPDTEKELLAACAEVHAMRRDLIAALGLKS